MTGPLFVIKRPEVLYRMGNTIPLNRMRMTSGAVTIEKTFSLEDRGIIREVFLEGMHQMSQERRGENLPEIRVTADFFDNNNVHVITSQWRVAGIRRDGWING